MSYEIGNTDDTLFKPFRKTDELTVGAEYNVQYLRKVKTMFGTRIRAFTDEFNYDLPTSFVVFLSTYDLDDIDYTNVRLHYLGRRNDSFQTIMMRITGLPPPNLKKQRNTNDDRNATLQSSANVSTSSSSSSTNVSAPPVSTNRNVTASTTRSNATVDNRNQDDYEGQLNAFLVPPDEILMDVDDIEQSSQSQNISTVAINLLQDFAISNSTLPLTSDNPDGNTLQRRRRQSSTPRQRQPRAPRQNSTPRRRRNPTIQLDAIVDDCSEDAEFDAMTDITCTICLRRPLDSVLLECGHRFCNICALLAKSRNACHCCRSRVKKIIKTYDP